MRTLPWRSPLPALSVVLALLAAPAAANARARLELTVEPGFTIPCNKYISVKGKEGDAHMRIGNTVGFSLQTSLLLNNWEFHYGMNQVKMTDIDLVVPDSLIQAAPQGVDVPKSVSSYLGSRLTFHSVTLGYRFYVMNRAGWRLFIPNGLGAAIVSGKAVSRSLFGASANLGFGADWQPFASFPYFLVNATVKYNFHITETSQELAGLGVLAGGSIWNSAVAMMHLVTVNVGIAGRW